ncbi:MAG: acyl-CoA thioester hydrolase [Thermoleophilaceae bacterium]|nr:acyl-CoA thioester hydrolase [Thermoleophilaceae bacterium]
MSAQQRIRGRVAWAETDASGQFHYSHAFLWAEAAESALWRRLGRLDLMDRTPRRSVEAEFLRSLAFDDEYEVTLSLERLGGTSITWGFEISSGRTCNVRGRTVIVYVDDAGRPQLVPDDVRELLTRG